MRQHQQGLPAGIEPPVPGAAADSLGGRASGATSDDTVSDEMIDRLLPACVVSHEEFTDSPGEAPFPGEEDLIVNAVESRRREFITARRCARRALTGLGLSAVPICPGPRREPLWQDGVVGSITHCAGYRAAAVARADHLASLGIDAEPDRPLPVEVEKAVTLPQERTMLDRLVAEAPGMHWDRLLFSAKESVYKAWYPLTRRWLDFADAELTVNPQAGSFRARILIDGGRLAGGAPLTELTGRYLVMRDLVLTAVSVWR